MGDIELKSTKFPEIEVSKTMYQYLKYIKEYKGKHYNISRVQMLWFASGALFLGVIGSFSHFMQDVPIWFSPLYYFGVILPYSFIVHLSE